MLAHAHRPRSAAPQVAAPAPTWAPDAQALWGNQALLAQLAPQDTDADFEHYMAVERAEGSNGWHMSYLDRGLAGSWLEDQVQDIPSRLASVPERGPAGRAAPMPLRGQAPESVQDMPWLHPDIKNASVAVASWGEQGLEASWHGRQDRANDQFWSATKHVQAIGLVSLINKQRPDLDIDTLMIREAGKPGTAVSLHGLLRDVVSYEGGAQRSNAGAAALARFQSTDTREARLEEWTGHDAEFRGGYGARPLFAQPELVTADGQVVATAPAAAGAKGQNLVSAYDLTRTMAMASWHEHLDAGQRIPDAQWHSLESVLRAMGYDSARYIDAAIERLGVGDRLQDVVVASKLGHGIRSATGLAETVYTGVLQFDDLAGGERTRRSVAFTLRGEHANPVELDARIAAEVTELLRRVLAGEL